MNNSFRNDKMKPKLTLTTNTMGILIIVCGTWVLIATNQRVRITFFLYLFNKKLTNGPVSMNNELKMVE